MILKKILVVEDSELLHKMYDLLLMRFRFAHHATRVLHAMNGREALAALHDNPDVDLVLLDINMPVMSGLEFLLYCREQKVFQDIPVIIISTEGKEQDTIRGLKAGARGYLTKPFQAPALYALMEKVCGQYLAEKDPQSPELAPSAMNNDKVQKGNRAKS
jgi:two-component system, chemotaxis family, chemotaxis protein CheY